MSISFCFVNRRALNVNVLLLLSPNAISNWMRCLIGLTKKHHANLNLVMQDSKCYLYMVIPIYVTILLKIIVQTKHFRIHYEYINAIQLILKLCYTLQINIYNFASILYIFNIYINIIFHKIHI